MHIAVQSKLFSGYYKILTRLLTMKATPSKWENHQHEKHKLQGKSICCLVHRQSVEESIKALSQEIIQSEADERFSLIMRRSHVLQDALEFVELATAQQLFLPLNVVFWTEAAVDQVGPTREFTSLLVLQCPNSYLMAGN